MADSELSEGTRGTSAKGAAERTELGRRAAADSRRAAEAKATIPHAYFRRRVEIGSEAGVLPAGVIAALAGALAEHRGLNAAYRDGAIERYSRVNIGFTVETPEGALVPTLFDADKMSMSEIADRIGQLSERAAAGELTAPELSGGTFSTSAVVEGADAFAPIVAPGQVGHLGIGRPRWAAVAEEGEAVRSASVAELTLAADQRAVRPPAAAGLLQTLAERLRADAQ